MNETPQAKSDTDVMRQATHSPSPWQWYWRTDEHGHTDCGVFYEKFKGQAYSICRAPRYQTKDQWEADAALICAAPELLELVRQYHEAMPTIESAKVLERCYPSNPECKIL